MSRITNEKMINNDIEIAKIEEKYYEKKKLAILQEQQIQEILKGHEEVLQGNVMPIEELWKKLKR